MLTQGVPAGRAAIGEGPCPEGVSDAAGAIEGAAPAAPIAPVAMPAPGAAADPEAGARCEGQASEMSWKKRRAMSATIFSTIPS
jgi:hypothetical protein